MNYSWATGALMAASCLAISACTLQEEMAPQPVAVATVAPAAQAEAKAPAMKATKVAGDVGLLDTEKNYMIIVTKEGKLVTIDFSEKFQPTMRTPTPAKIADIGLGSSATVQYTKDGDKNVARSIEYVPAKSE